MHAGLFDTAASQSEVCSELSRAMAMSPQGIHAILLVLTTSARFTAEEEACLNYLRSAYGGQLLRHCILVFTHGDSLEEEATPLEDFLSNCPESLQACALLRLQTCACTFDCFGCMIAAVVFMHAMGAQQSSKNGFWLLCLHVSSCVLHAQYGLLHAQYGLLHASEALHICNGFCLVCLHD